MSKVTTHVLDTFLGKPAAGIRIRLDKLESSSWVAISASTTDADGRCSDLAEIGATGVYRLSFETGAYLAREGRTGIYPGVSVTFTCSGEPHFHLPLLLSDNSYTTYREC